MSKKNNIRIRHHLLVSAMVLEKVDDVIGVVAQLLWRRDRLVEALRRRRLLAQRVDQLGNLFLHSPVTNNNVTLLICFIYLTLASLFTSFVKQHNTNLVFDSCFISLKFVIALDKRASQKQRFTNNFNKKCHKNKQ